jgi:hypothetical protein
MYNKLFRCNFSEMEIEMFFAKYDEDGDGVFSMKENSLAMRDIDKDVVDTQVLKTFLKSHIRYTLSQIDRV